MDETLSRVPPTLEQPDVRDGGAMAPPSRETVKVERGMVESYLLAGLRWSAVRWRQHPELLDRGIECFQYLAGRFYDRGRRGFMHLPLFLIVDLVALIELGDRTPFASEGNAHTWSQEERRLRVDYENLLLGTLLQEHSFVQARERLSLEGPARHGAAQRLAEILLQTFARYVPRWMVLNPAHLRNISAPPVEDIDPTTHMTRLNERYEDPFLFSDALGAMLRGISNNVYWREILQDEDLFEVENWAILDTESKRIGSRQITEVARRLREFRLPRVRVRDEVMEVETDYDDDTVYPTGGFAGLATKGSFENLVRSELVYMGEQVDPRSRVSLFDMRFVENELLFYMRNDGVMRRKRRFIHVVLDLDGAFHHKSPGYEYPFSTLTQGLVVRLTRDLLSTFEEDAVTVQIHYLHRPTGKGAPEQAAKQAERIEREMALLQLVLGREVRQERVFIQMVEDIDLDAMQHSRGRVYGVALAFNRHSEEFWREIFDDLEQAKPPVMGITVPVALNDPTEATYDDTVPLWLPLGLVFNRVAEIKNEIFARIISGSR